MVDTTKPSYDTVPLSELRARTAELLERVRTMRQLAEGMRATVTRAADPGQEGAVG
ncbi:MAG: hypothetical protein HYX34_01775 [Actinobacteria bacterium]|nr:hypothetical protein [Actinomycetota bacterium]